MPNFDESLREALRRTPRPRETDEDKHAWLTTLLDAYNILSTGTALLLKDEEARRGQKIGCGPGCSGCCLRPEVPVSQLELLGVCWYVMEKLDPDTHSKLNEKLLHYRQSIECPFLMEGRCAIYPLRPLACRFLHVFGSPCKHEEIPVQDRPQDVWLPREAVPPAILTMLPYFGFNTEEACRQALQDGYIAEVSVLMSSFPWENLATAKKK